MLNILVIRHSALRECEKSECLLNELIPALGAQHTSTKIKLVEKLSIFKATKQFPNELDLVGAGGERIPWWTCMYALKPGKNSPGLDLVLLFEQTKPSSCPYLILNVQCRCVSSFKRK